MLAVISNWHPNFKPVILLLLLLINRTYITIRHSSLFTITNPFLTRVFQTLSVFIS